MADVRRESMRIAGEHVGAGERVIEVLNPWNGALVGTVPKGSPADVRRAFAAARAFRSPLSRHERFIILSRAAERLAARREEISDLITAESGLCKKDTLYEVGRAAHFTGYRPTYLFLRSLFKARKELAALALIGGYTAAAVRREPRCDDPLARDFLRRQQAFRRLPVRAREALGRPRSAA